LHGSINERFARDFQAVFGSFRRGLKRKKAHPTGVRQITHGYNYCIRACFHRQAKVLARQDFIAYFRGLRLAVNSGVRFFARMKCLGPALIFFSKRLRFEEFVGW